MDKKTLIQEEINKLDLTLQMVQEEIKKFELIGNTDRVNFEKRSIGYLNEEKEKYLKMLAEIE